MPSYATLAEFQSYAAGQTIDPTLGQMLLDMATSAVDAFCLRTFQLTRLTETIYGNGSNVIMVANYPVSAVYAIRLQLPGNMGPSINVGQVIVDPAIGKITNFSVLTLQTIGVSALFPRDIPIQVDYAHGPRAIVSGDTGTATDTTYKIFTFTNQNWFLAAPITVYKNGMPLNCGLDYTIDLMNGRVILTVPAESTDIINADYWCYQVPADIKLATLMIALKQLNISKQDNLFVASEGDSDFKTSYNIQTPLAALDGQITALLAPHKRKGVA